MLRRDTVSRPAGLSRWAVPPRQTFQCLSVGATYIRSSLSGSLKIGTMESDEKELTRVYQVGRKETRKRLSDLINYLKEE